MPSIYPTELPVVKKKQSEKTFPAIDVVVDKFVFDSKNLGKLKLIANQRDEGWLIEELNVTNKDRWVGRDHRVGG